MTLVKPESVRRSAARQVVRDLARQKSGLVGIAIIAAVLLAAILAPHLSDNSPTRINLEERLVSPLSVTDGGFRVLGTDGLGRDVFTRILFGARISVIVGITATSISALIGIVLGLIAGFYGGLPDVLTSRSAEIVLAFPFILLALTFLAILGNGLLQIILVLGVGRWATFFRVIRGRVLSLRDLEFVVASRAVGASNTRIMVRHILPNIAAPVIVVGSFTIATNILAEAALSFLGLGLDPAIPAWGSMLAEGREYLPRGWWIATFSGSAIMITVLGINLVGDWLRDHLDPRLKL
jgi:peptide/nickel transport system permease protein